MTGPVPLAEIVCEWSRSASRAGGAISSGSKHAHRVLAHTARWLGQHPLERSHAWLILHADRSLAHRRHSRRLGNLAAEVHLRTSME